MSELSFWMMESQTDAFLYNQLLMIIATIIPTIGITAKDLEDPPRWEPHEIEQKSEKLITGYFW
jgi:hypothetical protein